jgi:hypothetical protein
MKQIMLSDGACKCLVKILEQTLDEAADCGCNDPDDRILKLFTDEELEEMLFCMYGAKGVKKLRKEFEEENEDNQTWEKALRKGWNLFNTSHIGYLLSSIKKQIKVQKG